MYKYRLTFSKTGYAKYVSHLDLMRMFQRAFKRAELPISYSQGFNPHQKISIGFPLPLGVTGTKEYMDIELDEKLENTVLCDRLNYALPPDIRVTFACEPKQKTSSLQLASYTVHAELKCTILNLQEQVEQVLNMPQIFVEKKTKKGIAETDIKPSVVKADISASENVLDMQLVLSCADGASLKATVVLDALKKYIENFETERVRINRDGLFLENMIEIC